MTTATIASVHAEKAGLPGLISAFVSEPPTGLPIPMFLDAHEHYFSARKTLSRVLPWQGTFSVYMQSEPAQHLVRSIEPTWAAVRLLQGAYRARLDEDAEAQFDASVLLDPDVDPAPSQEWTVRTYTLSTTPDDSIPDFCWDDFDVDVED